jgi:hypothetical protein
MSQNWTPPPAGGGAGGPGGTPPNNYLIPAILAIFCCWPLAIPAIIFAIQVNSKAAAGDMQGAMEASKKAKLFSFIGLGIGVVCGILWLLLFGFSAIMGNR